MTNPLNRSRSSRTASIALTVALAVAGAAPVGPAGAGMPSTQAGVAVPVDHTQLPSGWDVSADRSGMRLAWRSPTPIAAAAAPLEFRLDGRLLGYPGLAADGRTWVLELGAVPSGDLSRLQVWRSGRRVDGADQGRRSGDDTSTWPMTGRRRLLDVDPGRPGRWEVEESDYALGDLAVPDFAEPVEVAAHVVAPQAAPGERPLVLFLHGAHGTCFSPDRDALLTQWPCPDGDTAVPNHLGYRYLQRLLASQGYVTASISANGVNGQEFDLAAEDFGATQRSVLVRHHLRRWARWAAGEGELGNRWGGRVDLDRVLLVGHSRGGEGMARAAIDTAADAPWRIAGQVLIAPTAFGLQQAPYVPTVALLPYCDGDVVWLSGQMYVDLGRDVVRDPALRSAVMVMGANHNFFNTEWTPGLTSTLAGDDAVPLEPCRPDSPERLRAKEQRAVGRAYVAGAARLLLRDNRSVLPLYDGSWARVESAGRAEVLSSALGGGRRVLRPGYDGSAVGSGGARVQLCEGRSAGTEPDLCGGGRSEFQAPHWPAASLSDAAPAAPAVQMSWSERGASGGLALHQPADLSRARTLDLRVIVDPKRGPVRLAVRLIDADGQSATVRPRWRGRLRPFPGRHPLGKLWGQTLRAGLDEVAGVDLTRISQISLAARSQTGRVWLLDAAARRTALPALPDARVPRVDVEDASTVEGSDGTTGFVEVPLDFDAPLTRSAVLSVLTVDLTAGEARTFRLRVPAGRDSAVVRVAYDRDERDDFDVNEHVVRIFPQRRVMTSDYRATVRVLDDDPAARASISPRFQDVAEGGSLTWRVRLDRPADYPVVIELAPVAVSAGQVPLETGDLPRRFLRRMGIDPDAPSRPLAETDLVLNAALSPGTTARKVAIPIRVDEGSEPVEAVRLRSEPHPALPDPIRVTGTVTDG